MRIIKVGGIVSSMLLLAMLALLGAVVFAPAVLGADTTNPTIQISAPNSLGYVTTNVNFLIMTGIASDDVEVTSVTWSNSATGGSGTATGTTSWETGSIPLNPGLNNISVTAWDSSGNWATDWMDATYIASSDTTDPVITILAPSSGGTFSTEGSTVIVEGTATDNVGVTEVTWQNSRGGSGTATMVGDEWVTGPVELQQGGNVITVKAHDAANNEGVSSITITYSPSSSPDFSIRDWWWGLIGLIAVIVVLLIAYLIWRGRSRHP